MPKMWLSPISINTDRDLNLIICGLNLVLYNPTYLALTRNPYKNVNLNQKTNKLRFKFKTRGNLIVAF
jgi:hypothetical protein